MNLKKIVFTFMIILISLAGLMFFQLSTGEKVVKDYYTYTKAVCTEKNFCQDYVITCENKEMTSMQKITGAAVQYSEDWTDKRDNLEIICD